jgi:hypothetical protein
MSNTRRDIIVSKYLQFQKELKQLNFDCSIFPSLDEVDLVDLLVLFNMYFNSLTNVEDSLNQLLLLNNVSCTEEVKSICIKFITWFLEFQKNN